MNFIQKIKSTINKGVSRSIVITGNIYDHFYDGKDYVPLIDLLTSELKSEPTQNNKGIAQLVYELNNPIEIQGERSKSEELIGLWEMFKPSDVSLTERLQMSNKNATHAFEVMRQLTEITRFNKKTKNNLLMIIEAADMLIPENEISRMNINDRRRVAIMHDWFSDPAFMTGGDTVLLLAESRSALHHRIVKLPQVVSIEISLPTLEERKHFIKLFEEKIGFKCFNIDDATEQTAGLSILAIRQLMLSRDLSKENIDLKVEEYMISQLGDGVVEFKRPIQDLDKDIIGNQKVVKFAKKVLLPGFKNGTIRGAAFGGPIGGGKTYICEAIAKRFDGPVIVLKNIRSKWFGETDAIFERLRRLLESFHKIAIFVDEADTQFGGVGAGTHDTERRLTGKIQAMMSDVQLKGKVVWFLLTARIHLLSPDIRRPGRMDIIVPILDPEGQDREDFIDWLIEDRVISKKSIGKKDLLKTLHELTKGYSAGAFATLKSLAKNATTIEDLLEVANDMLPPDIGPTREYQKLQAQINCTRASLLFDEIPKRSVINKVRENWKKRIQELEMEGVTGV